MGVDVESHLVVNPHAEDVCNCGNKGCLELYTSATGVVRMANRRLAATEDATTLRNFNPLTAKDVFDEAKAGDSVANEIVDEVGRILGNTLGKIAIVVNPEVFVIGGGVSKAGSILIDAIQKHFKNAVFYAVKETRFELATLGNDAGIYGCIAMVL